MHFERHFGEMLFKCIKLHFFLEYFFFFLNMCLPYLKFSDLLPKTHSLFYLALPKVILLIVLVYILFMLIKTFAIVYIYVNIFVQMRIHPSALL